MNNTATKENPAMQDSNICLPSSNLKDATFGMRVLHCVIPHGHTLKDILRPEYWKHNAAIVGPFTKIYCDFEDGKSFLMLNVVASERTWAKVQVITHVKFDGKEVDDIAEVMNDGDDEYEVLWKGPKNLYSVIRKSDGEYLKKECAQKEEALEWLAQFKASL